MNVLGYVLIWVGFLGFGVLCEQRKENRRLKKQLKKTEHPPKIQRNFRSLIA